MTLFTWDNKFGITHTVRFISMFHSLFWFH